MVVVCMKPQGFFITAGFQRGVGRGVHDTTGVRAGWERWRCFDSDKRAQGANPNASRAGDAIGCVASSRLHLHPPLPRHSKRLLSSDARVSYSAVAFEERPPLTCRRQRALEPSVA